MGAMVACLMSIGHEKGHISLDVENIDITIKFI
jgi:hypothetical protein